MAIEILRDLRGLRVQVIHPPDASAWIWWAICVASAARWMALADPGSGGGGGRSRAGRRPRKSRRHPAPAEVSFDGDGPTLIAVVGYEDPSTLQFVLDAGADAVIERPMRPFGLLTQLTDRAQPLAREARDRQRIRKLERKLSGLQRIQKAKAILMDGQGLSEAEAYQTIRRRRWRSACRWTTWRWRSSTQMKLLQYRQNMFSFYNCGRTKWF